MHEAREPSCLNQNMHTHGLESQPDGPCWRLQTTRNMVRGARMHYTPARGDTPTAVNEGSASFLLLVCVCVCKPTLCTSPLIATCCFARCTSACVLLQRRLTGSSGCPAHGLRKLCPGLNLSDRSRTVESRHDRRLAFHRLHIDQISPSSSST